MLYTTKTRIAVGVETASALDETIAALIEPLTVACDDAQSTDVPDAFHRIVVPRTFAPGQPSPNSPQPKLQIRPVDTPT